jgi:hypothetical protein
MDGEDSSVCQAAINLKYVRMEEQPDMELLRCGSWP